MGVSAETLARFWAKVETTTDCWLWTANQVRGYGQFVLPRVGGVQCHVYAHRFAYELSYGLIGSRAIKACHRCDTPLCVRPYHLFLGSQADNLNDARGKGRLVDGLHARKLSDAAYADILSAPRLYGSGLALARKYGVTTVTISRIRSGRSGRIYLGQGALQPVLAEPHQAERDGQIPLQAAQIRGRLIPSPEIGTACRHVE